MKKVYDTSLNGVSGVYGIRFLGTDWFAYYGSSENIYQRFASHRSNLSRGVHTNTQLQELYNTHGAEKMHMFVIGEVNDKHEREELEQRLIAAAPCCNVVSGKGSTGRVNSDEEIALKRAERWKCQDLPEIEKLGPEHVGFKGNTRSRGKIIRADKEGKIVAVYDSIRDAHADGYTHSGRISDCANGKSGSYKGARWAYQYAA